jgi:transcriptional regulator with XRE-family HTH domain
MPSLLNQIKTRRHALGLKQQDMRLRVGMSRQQYQRLESKGNPRLDTLELIAKGLCSELVLVPSDKLAAVMALLAEQAPVQSVAESQGLYEQPSLIDDPWQGLLDDDE